MSKKIITINTLKSNCSGGIETLIRNIHLLFKDFELFEYYRLDNSSEVYEKESSVFYKKYGFGDTLLARFLSKLNLYRKFFFSGFSGDVIIVFHVADLIFIPKAIRKRNKIILVQTNRFDIYFTKLGKVSIRKSFPEVDFFTVYTEMDREYIKENFSFLLDKTVVLPRGCRIPTKKTCAKFCNQLVTIARLDEKQKNIQGMIEIIEKLPDSYSLDIYGDGNEEEVEKIKKIVSNSGKVRFMGAATDIVEVLSKYSVFLMTSRYEGFGQTLIEARSQGLPIVLYDTFDAASFIIENNVNGFLIDFGDLDGFVNAIRAITINEDVFNEFSLNSIYKSKDTELSSVNDKWRGLINE